MQRMDPQDLSTRLIPFNLGLAILEHDNANNVALLPGDIVTIFSQSDLRVPELKQTKFVRLTGEFGASGVYRVKPGERLREMVREAGGLTPSAYLYGAQFGRASVRAEQQRRLDQMIAESEHDLNRRAAQMLATSTTDAELVSARANLEAERASLDLLRRIQPDGRIVLNMHPDDTTVDSIPDIALEDGDEFYVPTYRPRSRSSAMFTIKGPFCASPARPSVLICGMPVAPRATPTRDAFLWFAPTVV